MLHPTPCQSPSFILHGTHRASRYILLFPSPQARLAEVLTLKGEGLMLRKSASLYKAGSSNSLLKVKPDDDEEAVVLGHEEGQGRNAGRLG